MSNHPTCPHCRSRLQPADFASLLRQIPEADRERIMHESMTRKKDGPQLSRAGSFAPDGRGGMLFRGATSEDDPG